MRAGNLDVSRRRGGCTAARARRPVLTLVDEEQEATDPRRTFVRPIGAGEHGQQPPGVLSKANLFIFASSCENMPNTLLEGMASGLPIACSDRGPMPETLQDRGILSMPRSRHRSFGR